MPIRAARGSPSWRRQASGRRRCRQTGAHCPFGIVFVRPGPTEIGEHAIAHEFGNITLVACNLRRHRTLVGTDDVAHFLRIEPL